jgi:Protein of unknown function (DUF3429)
MRNISAQATIPASALALGLAGLIPFVAGAICSWGIVPFLAAGQGLRLIIVYGAIILSFLGGVRWGTAMGPYDAKRQAFEFSASVLGSLAGLAAVFLPAVPALTLLIAGFLMQGLWDVTTVESGRLPGWFGKLRMVLTAGAVVSLIVALVAAVII